MKTDKTFEAKTQGLLNSLSVRERKRFSQHLESKSDSKQNLLKLFRCLEEDNNRSKEFLFNHLFPNQTYQDKPIRYLLSDLNAELEHFLLVCHLENNPILSNVLLMQELINRGVEKAFNGLVAKQELLLLDEKIPKDSNYFLYQFLTEEGLLLAAGKNFKRHNESNIDTVVDRLDKFYLARKLQLCCEIVNVQNVLGANYKVFLLDEMVNYLSHHPMEDVPAVNIYFKILKTLTESDKEAHFHDLRKLLIDHETLFSQVELRDMYQYALNYCIKKINLGNVNYQRELFELYQKTLENRVLLTNGRISQWDYKNIVTLCMRLKELDWAQTFIHKFKEFLVEEERENAFKYNLAYLAFMRKDYSKTLSLLQKVDFTDVFYQLDTKAIVLKTYFEMGDELALDYHIKAFRIFLKRNRKISDYQRLIYSNLIYYTKKIHQNSYSLKKLNEIKLLLESKRQTADIQWLLEKIEES
ncbi:MAG: hypothetical protein K1X82_13720 [Bacteroidia bacterium]|nr:hypothetical protein [Bacteroidia bacterium]